MLFSIRHFARLALLPCLTLFLFACSNKAYDPNQEILDLQQIPQNASYFLPENAENLIIDRVQSEVRAENYKKKFLAPWRLTRPNQNNFDYLQQVLLSAQSERGYAENLRKWTDKNLSALIENAFYQSFPTMLQNAITVRNTNLRLAPTSAPYFTEPSKAGQGFPFDTFQNTSLHLGTPLKIFHKSQDEQWYFVEVSNLSGWVNVQDVGYVDEKIVKLYETANFVAIINDKSIIKNNLINIKAKIGAILPLVSKNNLQYIVAIPYKYEGTNTQISKISLGKGDVNLWPLELRTEKIAKLANQLIGELYGWGGLYGHRDCSSTLKDLFIPFGIWLPRNSWAQSREGEIIDLSNLSIEEKERLILNQAIAFQTFLYLPGHIGLYLGQYQGKAVMLHNIWGVRLKDDGRHIIGKNVITSLYPGMEIKKATSSLMERLKSFNIVIK